MRIPKRVKVGGKVYKVKFPYVFAERVDHTGQSCHSTNIIRVTAVSMNGEPRARENIEEIFVHELIHCVDDVYNAGALDEATVNRLGNGLYQVLKDNGLLAKGSA